MERKKRLIILGVILTCVLLIVVLSSALFSFKAISIECRTNMFVVTEADHQAIIDSGEFDYGKNILFTNFTKNIENIELKNPYVKVINIERKFPNYAVINIKERTPVVKLNCAGGGVYIVDDELKILNIVKTESGFNKSLNEDKLPVLTIDSSIKLNYDRGLSVGEFLDAPELKRIVSAFYNGVVTSEAVGDEIVANSCITTLDSIVVSYEPTLECNKYFLSFKMSSVHAEIYDSGENLTDNIYKVISLFIQYGEKYSLYKCSASGIVGKE